MSYDLRSPVKKYLDMSDKDLDWTFHHFNQGLISMALAATEKHFKNLGNRDAEKRKFFGEYLVDNQ